VISNERHTDAELRAGFEALSKQAVATSKCPAADRIWSGARGELPVADVETLALHAAECGACAEAWRVARVFGTPAKLAKPRRGWPWWIPAAAAIILAAGVSLIYFTRPAAVVVSPTTSTAAPSTTAAVPPAPTVFAMSVEKAPIQVPPRGEPVAGAGTDGKALPEELTVALEPYERGDYRTAADALGALRARYPDAAAPAFYEGVARLLNDDARGAIEPLEQARDRVAPSQLEDATWYLAAAYERAGRRDEALRFAGAICDLQGPRSAAACAAATALRQP
jgi:tetratricopeptide (TPR) repeat protein